VVGDLRGRDRHAHAEVFFEEADHVSNKRLFGFGHEAPDVAARRFAPAGHGDPDRARLEALARRHDDPIAAAPQREPGEGRCHSGVRRSVSPSPTGLQLAGPAFETSTTRERGAAARTQNDSV